MYLWDQRERSCYVMVITEAPMDEKDLLFKALDEFQKSHKVPVVQSTLPGFLDPRNEVVLAVFRFARIELGWAPKEEDDLIPVDEIAHPQDRECPVCGAAPGALCSGPDISHPNSSLGIEYSSKVHRARQED